MSGYASTYGCSESEAQHVCHSCPEARVREFARTRSSGWISTGYLATLLATVNNPTTWEDGKTSGDIIVLPETSGSYDPGDPKELKGFGSRKFSYGPREMVLSVNDPDYTDNYHFYNEISRRTNLVPFFVTSNLVHIFDKPASIKAKDPVADDLEEEVIWMVESKVTSENLPSKHALAPIASVFECPNF
jgi:hypothetical protein